MNKKALILFFFPLSLVACNSSVKKSSELIILDSIQTEFKESHMPLLSTIITKNYISDSLLIIYSKKNKKLLIYSVENHRIERSIKLDNQIGSQNSNVYINPFGKMYILNSEFNSISTRLIDDSTELQMKFPSVLDSFTVYCLGSTFRISADSQFVLDKIPSYISPIENKENFKNFFSMEMYRTYKIVDGSIRELNNFGAFPEDYKENFYNSFSPVSFFIENDSVVSYIFDKTDYIYTVSLKTGKTLGTIKLKNGGFNTNPINIEKTADLSTTKKYDIQNRISFILFKDKVDDCYLLIVKEPIEFINGDGTLNEWEDAPFSIYKVNMKGDIIEKVKIPDYIDPRYCIMYNNKIIMRRKHSKIVKFYITHLP